MSGGVLVFADLASEGGLGDTAKGILAEGARLARTLEAPWSAACFEGTPGEVREELRAFGVEKVLELGSLSASPADDPAFGAELLAGAAREVRVVLLAHDDLGATLAPLLAARLSAALFTEALSYGREWPGLSLRRHALGAQAVEERLWTADVPLVLTIARRALSPVVPAGTRPASPEVVRRSRSPRPEPRARVVARIPPDPRTVDVSEAEVIFCAGKGCDARAFEALSEVARLLGASLGVTRPVYDQGRAGFDRMIGQTGKTVLPRLYLGFGISGSMHHVGGIKDAKRILTVNADPKVPMFSNADEGFVADAGEVLPLLLERVREGLRGTSRGVGGAP